MERLLVVLLLALLIDRLIGDPCWLWRYVPHPVAFFGKMINRLETAGNRADFSPQKRRLHGWLAIVVLLAGATVIGWLLIKICLYWPMAGLFVEAIIVSLFLAQKSLADHVMAVHNALEEGGVEQGRSAVSTIVGRDPQALDTGGICRAAIESLAENSSDGIIAPAFWYAISGLPGLLAYKMLNTADSMIGHKNERYAAFGFAAARLDDIANYIPARLTGCLVVLAAFFTASKEAAKRAWRVMVRDSSNHGSPNAGWPESAFAGALDIRLAGPRHYGAAKVDELFQNAEGKEPDNADIPRAIRLFWAVMNIIIAFITGAVFILSFYVLYAIFL